MALTETEKSLLVIMQDNLARLSERLIKMEYKIENMQLVLNENMKMLTKVSKLADKELENNAGDNSNDINFIMDLAKKNPDEAKKLINSFLGV